MGGLRVLDLFCGIGGLSLGFSRAGFKVVGVDVDGQACAAYELNGVGEAVCADLLEFQVDGEFDLVVGGPPCEPWSVLNLSRRGERHPSYQCLRAFYDSVLRLRPAVFVMENVPSIAGDASFLECLRSVSRVGYALSRRVVRYSDYGASTARRRLFVVGVAGDLGFSPESIFNCIERRPAVTVREAIWDLRSREFDPSIEHVWPRARTVGKYFKYYSEGRYGWYILRWDSPAPSFGNVSKTYVLHPDLARPISVREAMRIMGLPDCFVFPHGVSLGKKYKMVADVVSPVFSSALALSVKRFLEINGRRNQ